MSDDRMDRAARIRNMREGNRGTDDETAESDATAEAETAASTDVSEPAASDSDSGHPSSGNDAASTESPGEPATDGSENDGATERATTGSDAATASGTGTTASEPPERSQPASTRTDATDSRSDASNSPAAADEAEAIAQRAAASAAEVMGTDAGETAEAGTDSEAATETDSPSVPADVTGASTVPGDVTGVELPDRELLEAAMATSSVESTEGGARAAMEEGSTQSEEVVRVLEFALGEEYYCLDIEYVEEIVKRSAVTRVPNTPDFVDGVVDLRGQITTILEPKEMMNIESEGEQNLIIVFDPEQFEEQGAVGWVVDEVRQVVPVAESDVNRPPVDAEYINGVVDRAEYDQFVIWVEPEDALSQATATEDE
ncbi:chemotaxis protein CheW [Haloarcula sp. S1CR25-12]|uniref:Chemotaxis protein CheW n=1 Tax=Haloarcula saliterrae TaxID=2950534 RepID=A0ABU2FB94_9EURY|nr:chemotaxis protein CheW [Haloarcula sp. S1CR25-12]MDS0259120.1 chemotaxis protein CheW [Haloarcula sp. S1CR25-12]